jgi:hypothetical protein
MKENHQDDGHSSQEVDLPESDYLPFLHKECLPPMLYRHAHPVIMVRCITGFWPCILMLKL